MALLNLKAVLGLNASGFQLGLKQAGSAADTFSSKLTSQFAQAFGVAAITAYAAKVINFADHITDLSDELGVSTKTLQDWASAAKRSGSNLDEVAKFFENLAVARDRAMKGDQSAQSSFWNLGINPNALGGMNLQQLAAQIATSVKSSQNVQNLIPSLKDVGGRSAASLIPTLQNGAEGIEGLAERLGLSLNDHVLQTIKDAKSELQGLADTFVGPVAQAIAFVAPRLRDAFSVFKIGAGGIKRFFGSLLSGGGLSEAKTAAMSALDDELKERERINTEITKTATTRSGYDSPIGPNLRESVIDMTPIVKKVVEITAGELTSNQRAGAFVRYDPAAGYLRDIARYTGRTADLLAQQKEIAVRNFQNINGFGAEKTEWQ